MPEPHTKKQPKIITVKIRMDEELFARLMAEVTRTGEGKSKVVRAALRRYLDSGGEAGTPIMAPAAPAAPVINQSASITSPRARKTKKVALRL